MVVPIGEVVDEVTRNRVDAVVHGALVGSATSSSKVCFQSGGASVQVAHDVGVVGPTFSKHVFKQVWELFECAPLCPSVYWLRNQVKLLKLLVCNVSTEDTLHNIGSIKAVHAVSSECSFLLLLYLNVIRIIYLISQIESEVNFCHEIVVSVQLFLDDID